MTDLSPVPANPRPYDEADVDHQDDQAKLRNRFHLILLNNGCELEVEVISTSQLFIFANFYVPAPVTALFTAPLFLVIQLQSFSPELWVPVRRGRVQGS